MAKIFEIHKYLNSLQRQNKTLIFQHEEMVMFLYLKALTEYKQPVYEKTINELIKMDLLMHFM